MTKKRYEYKCEQICKDVEDTEQLLNDLSKNGWRLVCSYAQYTRYLIFEREVSK